ncbi:hypothetical protein KCU62_g112, partial [Aureobasidium sp. EXF-3399]
MNIASLGGLWRKTRLRRRDSQHPQVVHLQVEIGETGTARCGTHSWSGGACSLEVRLFCVATDQVFLFQLYSLDSGVRFAVFGDEELFLVFGCLQLVSELLDLLVKGVEFGLEMLLLLLEDFRMLLLSLARCESVVRVSKLYQWTHKETLRCLPVPKKTLLCFELLHLILIRAPLNQIIDIVQCDLGRDGNLRVLLADAIASIASEKRLSCPSSQHEEVVTKRLVANSTHYVLEIEDGAGRRHDRTVDYQGRESFRIWRRSRHRRLSRPQSPLATSSSPEVYRLVHGHVEYRQRCRQHAPEFVATESLRGFILEVDQVVEPCRNLVGWHSCRNRKDEMRTLCKEEARRRGDVECRRIFVERNVLIIASCGWISSVHIMPVAAAPHRNGDCTLEAPPHPSGSPSPKTVTRHAGREYTCDCLETRPSHTLLSGRGASVIHKHSKPCPDKIRRQSSNAGMRSAPRESGMFAAGQSDQPLHGDIILQNKILNRDHEFCELAIRPLCIPCCPLEGLPTCIFAMSSVDPKHHARPLAACLNLEGCPEPHHLTLTRRLPFDRPLERLFSRAQQASSLPCSPFNRAGCKDRRPPSNQSHGLLPAAALPSVFPSLVSHQPRSVRISSGAYSVPSWWARHLRWAWSRQVWLGSVEFSHAWMEIVEVVQVRAQMIKHMSKVIRYASSRYHAKPRVVYHRAVKEARQTSRLLRHSLLSRGHITDLRQGKLSGTVMEARY